MSTISQNIAPRLTPTPEVGPPKRVRPYKPRLSTTIRIAMEASLRHALRTRTMIRKVLTWLEEERAQMTEEITSFEKLNQTGVADRATQLARSIHHRREARLGRLDHQLAELALDLAQVEDEIRGALDKAKVTGESSKKASRAQ